MDGGDSSASDQALLTKMLVMAEGDAEATAWLFRCSKRRPHLDRGSDYLEWERLLALDPAAAIKLIAPPTVNDVAPDAPEAAQATKLPRGYTYTATTIMAAVTKGKTTSNVVVADSPIVLLERLHHLDTGDVYLKLGWRRGGQWLTLTENRATLAADERALIQLAAKDFPVGRHNSALLLRYLYELDAVNNSERAAAQATTRRLTSTLGWQQDDSFLWGVTLLREHTASEQTAGLEFYPESTGDAQLVTGYHAAGTPDGWRQAVTPLAAHPAALFALYTSLAACVQQVVDAPNFRWTGQA